MSMSKHISWSRSNGLATVTNTHRSSDDKGRLGHLSHRSSTASSEVSGNVIARFGSSTLSPHTENRYAIFPWLLKYMTSGLVVAMIWQGLATVKTGCAMLGETGPLASSLGTIRGDFALDLDRTVCHGSDSFENAKKEIELLFPEGAVQYEARGSLASWIFE